jgi:hypothetical protein
MGYYTTIGTTGAGAFDIVANQTTPPTTDTLLIDTGVTCNGTTPTTNGAGARSFAAIYTIETGSGLSKQCTAS